MRTAVPSMRGQHGKEWRVRASSNGNENYERGERKEPEIPLNSNCQALIGRHYVIEAKSYP